MAAALPSTPGGSLWCCSGKKGVVCITGSSGSHRRCSLTGKVTASGRPSRCRSLSDLNNTSLSGPPASGIRALVSLQPRRESIVENEGHVNKKVLVSAAAVCFLTHVLTVQGMLLTGYLAAATALPVGAMNHAIKKRKAWPALGLLLPLILVPNVGILKALYMSLVNPVSVQVKARITLPAVIHALVGSKHPALKAGLTSAQVASQVVLLVLLLQYLFAPKIAEAMRQRAIMLCRAFTTTESQGIRFREGEAAMETWPNKQMKRRAEPEGFLHSLRREDPQQWGSCREGDEVDFERLGAKLRQTMFRNLPEGQQPDITDVLAHTETTGSQYSYVGARRAREAQAAFLEQADTPTRSGTGHGPTQEPAKDLELAFESDAEQQQGPLDGVMGGIPSPQELFEVLNEQLDTVQSLADELRSQGTALCQSEQAREDLARELEATVGEKRQLGQELTALALKFEAAQSLWERHDSLQGPFNEEVLDKVVAALTDHNRIQSEGPEGSDEEEQFEIVDGDALAAKFSTYPAAALGPVHAENDVKPFNKATSPAAATTAEANV